MSLYDCRSMYAHYHGDLDRMRARLHELDERSKGDDFGLKIMPVLVTVGTLITAVGSVAGNMNMVAFGIVLLTIGAIAAIVSLIDSKVGDDEHALLMERIRLMEEDLNGAYSTTDDTVHEEPKDVFLD